MPTTTTASAPTLIISESESNDDGKTYLSRDGGDFQ